MALKYYPLTRIRQNLYTRGEEFVLPDGRPYVGRYYLTYDGNAFTGVNPILGSNQPLTPASVTTTTPATSVAYNAATGQRAQTSVEQEDPLLTGLKPYYPVPTEDDYARGYFTRYFAKNVSGPGYIFEISKSDWSKIQNGQVEDTVLGYETADILWQLRGPLNDKRISQYQIQGGVLDTNKRVTEAEAKTFRGLVEFIGGEYTKFARITP